MTGNYHTNVRRSTGQRAAAVTFFFSLFTFSLSHCPQCLLSILSTIATDLYRVSLQPAKAVDILVSSIRNTLYTYLYILVQH